MPNLERNLDTIGVRDTTVCDVQHAYQIPVAASEQQDKTALVTQNGKWVYNDCLLVSRMHHFSSRE